MDPALDRFLDYLDRNKIRATYKAVAGAVGVPAQSLSALLGTRTPRASWVVNGTTGEPTGYDDYQKHPDLHRTTEVMTTAADLIRRIKSER